jgi:hypothetical protein
MDICGVVRRQIISYKNALIITSGNAIHFDIITDILTKIAKGICQCADVPDAMNPAPRPHNAAIHIWGEGWITWLDSKKDDDFFGRGHNGRPSAPERLSMPNPSSCCPSQLSHQTHQHQ